MNVSYEYVAERAKFRGEYCHAPAVLFNFQFEIEHIVPTSHGGDNEPANLALSCRACNVFKGPALFGVDPETQATVELFHPRIHQWAEHFEHEPETDEIVGMTPIGRATVQMLRFNRPNQIHARREWKKLGEFP